MTTLEPNAVAIVNRRQSPVGAVALSLSPVPIAVGRRRQVPIDRRSDGRTSLIDQSLPLVAAPDQPHTLQVGRAIVLVRERPSASAVVAVRSGSRLSARRRPGVRV